MVETAKDVEDREANENTRGEEKNKSIQHWS